MGLLTGDDGGWVNLMRPDVTSIFKKVIVIPPKKEGPKMFGAAQTGETTSMALSMYEGEIPVGSVPRREWTTLPDLLGVIDSG